MATDRITWPTDASAELSHSVLDPQRSIFHGDRGEWLLAPPMPGLEQWSLLARSREAQRRAREMLRAFIGPAVGALAVAESTRTLDIAGETHEVLVTPLVVRDGRSAQLIAAAERLVNVRAGQPEQLPIGQQSISALLRDFRLALSDGDVDVASELLDRLQGHPHLSRMNRQFLEVEFLARLGRWLELRGREWFVALMKQRRPASVTEYMLESVWIIDFERQDVHTWGDARFVFALLPDAVRTAPDGVDPIRGPARRLAALRASEQGSELRLAQLIEMDPSIRSWIDETTAPPPLAVDPSPEPEKPTAWDLFDAGRIADLVALVDRSGGRSADLAVAIRGVADHESATLAPRVLIWLDQAPEGDLPDNPGFRNAVARVRSLAEDRCDGWTSWFQRVSGGDRWPAAAEVARNNSERWKLDPLAVLGDRERIADQLEQALDGPNAESIDRVLDLLCDLAADLVESHGADRFVTAVSTALLYRAPSAKTVDALVQLVAVVLEHSPTPTAYGELADVCSDPALVTPRAHIPAVLDLLDVFVARVRIEPGFSSFVGAAQSALIAHRSHGRLDGEERRLAAELLAEAGRPTPQLEPDEIEVAEVDHWAALDGKTVFLYTLFNGLGARFEQRLEDRCATVMVTHSADKAASDRLRQLAAGADYVVVHTRHASHAATIAIDQVVPRSEQLLGNGKGMSSLLLTLFNELARPAMAIR